MAANVILYGETEKPRLTNLNPDLPPSFYERRSSVFSNVTTASSSSSRTSDLEAEKAAFCSSLQKFFNNDTFSDASVHCQGQAFKVHSLVLSMHSEFFAKAFSGPWKESGNGRHIDLEEVELAGVEAMLHFMYHFEYSHPEGWYPLQFDAMIYSLADRYMIPQLKEYSKNKFQSAISEDWENVDDELPDDVPSVIAEVFETTPESDRGLRDIVLEVCHRQMTAFSQHETFKAILDDTPAFATDLVKYTQKEADVPPPNSWCLSCYEPRKFQEAFCSVCHTSFGVEDVSATDWPGARSGSISC